MGESNLSGECEERLPIVSIEELAGPDHQKGEGLFLDHGDGVPRPFE